MTRDIKFILLNKKVHSLSIYQGLNNNCVILTIFCKQTNILKCQKNNRFQYGVIFSKCKQQT